MLQESTIIEVAKVFFKEPTQEHYLKEISKKADVAHTSVKKHLEKLTNEGIIKETIQKKGSRNFPVYTANVDGGAYKRMKRGYNRDNLSLYGLLNFLSIKLMPRTLVLFGSYARGEDTEDSDIDIFVEAKKKDMDLSSYEKYSEFNRKIQIHFSEKLKELPKELKNNIVNGVVLKGYLEAY